MDAVTNFWSTPGGWTLLTALQILAVLGWLLVSLAFFMYGDRKIWAGVQMRKGPNIVGPFGLLQSFADLIKFVLKELIIPAGADKAVFLLAPLISVTLALGAWAVMPIAPGWAVSDINVGILYLFAVSSMGVYGIIMGGWASNSKYPFLGSLRSAAQMVSYEVSIGFVIITVILLAGTMNLQQIVVTQNAGSIFGWDGLGNPYILTQFVGFLVFMIAVQAELTQTPFDMPIAESELGAVIAYAAVPASTSIATVRDHVVVDQMVESHRNHVCPRVISGGDYRSMRV